MTFTKSLVLAGLQCDRQLWLRVHRPELAQPTESPLTLTGKAVERHARELFPGAVQVARNIPGIDPFAETATLLGDPGVTAILEAGIYAADLAVFIDVLERDATGGGWLLTEIKAATSVKDVHVEDVAVQALALHLAGVPVRHFRLLHINSRFVYRGNHDYAGVFVHADISKRVLAHQPFMAAQLDAFRKLLAGPQPARRIGSHCNSPWPCPFKTHCEAQDARYPVAWLPNGADAARRLIAQGIYDIRDIPADALDSERQLRVRRVTLAGQPELLQDAARQLRALGWPRYFLDFECIQFALPRWAGTRPYQQLPFQWSCHVQTQPGGLVHHEFLDDSGSDPRRRFAAALLAACGDTGPIIVYNQSFERRVVRELAELLPELSGPLLALAVRMFDLLPVVRDNYYHPDMRGSWSIKRVLPCLVPELSYTRLGRVQDGLQAQAGYLELIAAGPDTPGREALRRDLLAYCELDTLAMLKIVERLCT
jgi:hypothetical protein